ncbi:MULTISPECIES: radical SAM protein [unclassified Archaeoglobus]|uniref:radical SAM protein n=1 Tax=unclassified Archaeoglobus TaxID=2643606 RepID=UPI0025C2B384|nr:MULTISPECIES: radical SAM protein [unclassified Archaeoglobus]
MVASYLDLHIIDFCQLNCKHCYLKRNNENLTTMDIEMLKNICNDFLNTDFPFSKKSIILSGGEPLLHPKFAEICELVRMLVGSVRLSTNGILIPKYIHLFRRWDGIQVSVDGDRRTHDFIRGQGSYDHAVNALFLLDEKRINHSVGFTINCLNSNCVDHIINLCVNTGSMTLNLNLYHPVQSNEFIKPITFKKWIEIKEYATKRAEKL